MSVTVHVSIVNAVCGCSAHPPQPPAVPLNSCRAVALERTQPFRSRPLSLPSFSLSTLTLCRSSAASPLRPSLLRPSPSSRALRLPAAAGRTASSTSCAPTDTREESTCFVHVSHPHHVSHACHIFTLNTCVTVFHTCHVHHPDHMSCISHSSHVSHCHVFPTRSSPWTITTKASNTPSRRVCTLTHARTKERTHVHALRVELDRRTHT